MSTITLHILSPTIIQLLYELQNSNMVKVVDFAEIEELPQQQPVARIERLSDKYRGAISREKGNELLTHINTIRNEWNDTL